MCSTCVVRRLGACVRVSRSGGLPQPLAHAQSLWLLAHFPPSATPRFRMCNGRVIAPPAAIPANTGDAAREWKTLLTKFEIATDVADGLIKYIVESEGLASFDDFRRNFRESTGFRAELVVKAKMPDGATAID